MTIKRSKFKYHIGQIIKFDNGPTEYSRWNGYDDYVDAVVIRLEESNGEPYITIIDINGSTKRILQRQLLDVRKHI